MGIYMERKNKCIDIIKSIVSNIWYVVAIIAVIAIVFLLFANWGEVWHIVGRFIGILMPFIFGFFFAYLIKPLVGMISRGLNLISPHKGKKIKRMISVLISYIIVIGILAVIIIYIFPQIRDSAKDMGKSVQDGYKYMITHEKEINDKIPFMDISGIIDYMKKFLYDKIMNHGSDWFPYVYQLSSSLIVTLYNVLMGLVISIYIVLDSKKLKQSIKKMIYAVSPSKKEEEVWDTIKQCNHIFNGFLIGKVIDSLIIGIICLVAMIILQLPYALLLSLIVCITNMIPYFGPIIGAVPGVLIYLFIEPRLAIVFAVLILILQQFDGLYLGPKILGDQTGIKPLWVIFGITVGGAYFGVLGMFLGVPTVAVLTYLINLIMEKKLKRKNISSFDSQ